MIGHLTAVTLSALLVLILAFWTFPYEFGERLYRVPFWLLVSSPALFLMAGLLLAFLVDRNMTRG